MQPMTNEQLERILATGEWAIGDYGPSLFGHQRISAFTIRSSDIVIEYRDHRGLIAPVLLNVLDGEIRIEGTDDHVRILQLGTRQEQVKKSEGGGWRRIAHWFVRLKLVHIPTKEARDREWIEHEKAERLRREQEQKLLVTQRREQAERERIAEVAQSHAIVEAAKTQMRDARILDIVRDENGLRIVCDNGKSLRVSLVDDPEGRDHLIDRYYNEAGVTLEVEPN